MDRNPRAEKAVLIHLASSTAEAMVIRGLLESSGIASPGSVTTEQFPVNELREGDHAVEVVVRESQVVEARRIIADYLRTNEEIEAEDSSHENPGS
ncbi:MAG TPA: hypothetical protein VGT03_04505 [Candidatus Acidoferrales bacterium]|nr:hypothetical protein [Candidatus Acidoferrales bacterium]